MGDEIDSYILVKLEEAIAIADAPSSHFNIATKLFFLKPTLSEQFKSLKNLLSPSPAATNDSTTSAATNGPNTSTSAGGGVDPTARREHLYYLNNVLTEWQMITQDKFSFRNSYSSLLDLRQSLTKIKQDLKRGDGGSSHPHTSDSAPHVTPPEAEAEAEAEAAPAEAVTPPEEFRWSTRHAEKLVRGIDSQLLSLERLLVLQRQHDGDAFKAFGIHGMAGIGKTTMCQAIFASPKVVDFFFPRIWVCMSKQNVEQNGQHQNRKEIVTRMLMCLGVDEEIIDQIDELKRLVLALRLQLTGKRYLVVLDDAWSEDTWFNLMDSSNNDTFAYALPKDCGGTVIVTSRMKKVAANMIGEGAKLRCLTTLDDETCWEIYKDWAEADAPPNETSSPKPSKEQISKRCLGLPLAAKMMGDFIRSKMLDSAQANQAQAVHN